MNKKLKLPIGIEDFGKIRTEGFYFVDKTKLIRELLNNWGEVNLFTRPRRFGKSLNMNMLKYFFEYGCDTSLNQSLFMGGLRRIGLLMTWCIRTKCLPEPTGVMEQPRESMQWNVRSMSWPVNYL